MDISRYKVPFDKQVTLADFDPADRSEFEGSKSQGKAQFVTLNARLEALQELLYAQGKHKLLVVFQAIDAGGKDSSIRHIFDGTNPQGVKVASFKKPTSIELAHDYLWRVHQHAPASGEMTLFNRSHYEDVLVVRVHGFVPEERWQRRYEHINAFEKMLADEGTTIIKFFLHISKDEQKERFQDRLDDPRKHWKFSKADLKERALWDDYQAAFAEMLSRTSTPWAPWYVIPANRKWYRNLVISTALTDTLDALGMTFPAAEDGLEGLVIPD